MKQLFVLVLIFLLSGCNSFSNSSSTSINSDDSSFTSINSDDGLLVTDENQDLVEVFDSLLYQQWAIEYNQTFYTQNNIDENAHIHGSNSFENYKGDGVVVAVIDNGFDITHPEIKDKIIKTIDYKTRSSDVSHNSLEDHHGTSVTGIIAARDNNGGVRGVAPNVSLILIKLPNSLDEADVIDIIELAINEGADVINCSWGTGDISTNTKDTITQLVNNAKNGLGVPIVFASGNNNGDISSDESSIEGVIGVGAIDKNNLRITEYSNYGDELDIVAPGGYELGITTIDPVGIDGVSSDGFLRFDEIKDGDEVSFIGTSAAAPIVTGAIALLIEQNPQISLDQIKQKLYQNTDTIGYNTPYIEDIQVFDTTTPTFNGIYGTSGYSALELSIKNIDTNSNVTISLNSSGDNSWSGTSSTQLPNGNYHAILKEKTSNLVWAEDYFEINTSKDFQNNGWLNSNYYGHGKLNIDKMMGY